MVGREVEEKKKVLEGEKGEKVKTKRGIKRSEKEMMGEERMGQTGMGDRK